MRTKQLIVGLNNSQRIRVFLDGHGIYTTVKAALSGLFATTKSHEAVEYALREMGGLQPASKGERVQGFSTRVRTTYGSVDVQVDLI